MKRKPLIMTFSRLAEGYLAERIVSSTYAANLRRVAARAGEVTMERTNAYLRQRAGEVAGITLRSEPVAEEHAKDASDPLTSRSSME